MSHVRCRCGHVYRILDGRGLCPRCVSLTPPTSPTVPQEPADRPREDQP